MGLDARTGGLAEAFADVRARLNQANPGLREGFGVLRRHDGAGFAQNRARVADVGDDRGDAAGHGFGQSVREGFAGGAGRGDVERIDNAGDIVAATEEIAGVSDASRFRPILQFGVFSVSAISAEDEADIGELLVEQPRRLEKSSVILHRMLAGDIADQQGRGINSEFAANGFACIGVWAEEVEVDIRSGSPPCRRVRSRAFRERFATLPRRK